MGEETDSPPGESPADAAALASGETARKANGATAPHVSRMPPAPQPLPEPVLGSRGTPLVLADGRTWQLPPLLLDDVFGRAGELVLAIIQVGGPLEAGKPDAIVPFIFSGAKEWLYDLAFLGFRRNYPELARADVPVLFDTEAAFAFLHAVIDPLRERFARLGLGSLLPGATSATPVH